MYRWPLLVVVAILSSQAPVLARTAPASQPATVSGFLGDGSGVYAHATPPTVWDDKTARNIRWKVPTPSWSCASPIAVGKKVFILSEPFTLICHDADTGKVLWQRDIDPLDAFAPEHAKRARELWAAELSKHIEAWMIVWQARTGRRLIDKGPRSYRELEQTPYYFSTHEPHCYAKGTPQRKESDKIRGELARDFGLCFEYWPGWVGHTFATPVTDGEHIYVSMGWSQVACYDLDGNRRWLKWFKPDADGSYQPGLDGYPSSLFCNSPLLLDDKLIVQAGSWIRLLRKDTGQTLWEVKYKPLRFTAGTSAIMRLPGKDLLITGHEKVYDLATGKVVAEGLPEGYASPVVHGDIAYLTNYSAHRARDKHTTCHAYQFWVKPDGSVGVKKLWSAAGAASWTGPVYHKGRLYVDSVVLDAATGKNLAYYRGGTSMGPHAVIAGDYYFLPSKSGRTVVVQISTNQVLGTNTLLSDDPRRTFKADGPLEDVKQRWFAKGVYGLDGILVATPVFQGRRMYIRTHEYLYCVEAPQ